MNIVKYRKIFFTFSILMLVVALFSIFTYGLNLGTDFTGGTLVEVQYTGNRPAVEEIKAKIDTLNLGSVSLQTVGDKGLTIKTKDITTEEKQALYKALSLDEKSPFTQERYSQIGPALGKELSNKGLIAIALVVILIIIYVAFAFRQVSSHYMKSWKYGVAAIVALVHDITISAGAMALLGHFYGAEADALFLTALLTILGLSVNDTIVVFDRIRENLHRHSANDFATVAGISINETYIRSINTTLTIIITLVAMFFFGPESTKFFSAILLVGMTVGTYSSIFVASNLLVTWEAWQRGNQPVKIKK